MLDYIQSDFSGGMDLFNENYNIPNNGYGLSYNIRNRTGALSSISAPVEDTSAPSGLKQGLFAFDNYIVLFNNGAAYYKNIVSDTAWVKISNFAMSTTAPNIYTEAVPASKNNFTRKLNDANRADGSNAESNVSLDPTVEITENPAGLVCQDGISQPYIILSDASARILKDYSQWKLSDREYVPKMKQMRYVNGILFGVKYNDPKTIYRSVSGRPLDFVISIDTQGNKQGDADAMALSFGFNDITCLSALNSGELLVGTTKTLHPVEFNYDKVIFAEPTFLNRRTLSVGVVNHYSFIDRRGDYCMVDVDGIRSFNAVSNLQNEGRNSIFSRQIAKALAGIKQTASAAIVYDDYSIFAVKTIYGDNLLAIYDNTREVWVCFDNLGIGAPIKQFAVGNQSVNPVLWAITADKIYKLYSSPDELEAQVYLKGLTAGKASLTIRLNYFHAVFDGGTTEDEATLTEFVNNIEGASWNRDISSDENGEVDATTFNLSGQTKQGWKIAPRLKWQNESKVAMVEVKATEATSNVALKQKVNTFATGQMVNGG